MDFEFHSLIEIEKQRAALFAERAKPRMTMDEYVKLNTEILQLFPVTEEERLQKFERLKAIPEFVL